MLAVFSPGTPPPPPWTAFPPSFLKLGSLPRRLPRSCRFSMIDGLESSIARATGSLVVRMCMGMGTGTAKTQMWWWWLRIGRKVVRSKELRRRRRRVVDRAMVLCVFSCFCLMLTAGWVRVEYGVIQKKRKNEKRCSLLLYISTFTL